MDVLPEPVDKWTNLNGTDLLDLLFKDPKRWALAQESYVQLTMLEEHLVRFPLLENVTISQCHLSRDYLIGTKIPSL